MNTATCANRISTQESLDIAILVDVGFVRAVMSDLSSATIYPSWIVSNLSACIQGLRDYQEKGSQVAKAGLILRRLRHD